MRRKFCKVNTAVKNSVLENEVNILLGWNVIDWTLLDDNKDNKIIESITIRSGAKVKIVTCDFLFNFYEKEIDVNSFLGNGI